MTEFLRVEAGSWLSDDGRYEVYFALEAGHPRWKVWDSDRGEAVNPPDERFATRSEATLWLLNEYAPAHP